MERNYEFLKKKYYELLYPTIMIEMSETLCSYIDIILIAMILGFSQLPAIEITYPFTYASLTFYIIFGQGGTLLALRARSQLDIKKKNLYYTLSITGIIAVSLIYLATILLFADNFLHLLNTPADIFNSAKNYLYIISVFIALNSYIMVAAYFIRSDGNGKIPFYTILMSNILNLIFDIIFLKVLNMGFESTALASVLGFSVGACYITINMLKNCSYNFISLKKFKVEEILASLMKIITNTPETVGTVLYFFKIGIYTFLCSTYYGSVGLLAFLIYDSSEGLIYIFLSGIIRTVSPIVAIFYKEKDYNAVAYIVKGSIKQVLILCVPISILLFVYPEILIKLFNVKDPYSISVASAAIRITAFGFTARCLSHLLSNYCQTIELNKITFIIFFLEEGLIPIAGSIILIQIIGAEGIWYSILLADTIPILIFFLYNRYEQRKNKERINHLFLKKSVLVDFTLKRDEGMIKKEKVEKNEFLKDKIKSYTNASMNLLKTVNKICQEIFDKDKPLDKIDITLRENNDDSVSISILSAGKTYNPLSNQELNEVITTEYLNNLNYNLDYITILGFNKTYINISTINKKTDIASLQLKNNSSKDIFEKNRP